MNINASLVVVRGPETISQSAKELETLLRERVPRANIEIIDCLRPEALQRGWLQSTARELLENLCRLTKNSDVRHPLQIHTRAPYSPYEEGSIPNPKIVLLVHGTGGWVAKQVRYIRAYSRLEIFIDSTNFSGFVFCRQ